MPVIVRVEDRGLRLRGNPPKLIRATAASAGNVHYQRGAGITCDRALHPVTPSVRSRVARRAGHLTNNYDLPRPDWEAAAGRDKRFRPRPYGNGRFRVADNATGTCAPQLDCL